MFQVLDSITQIYFVTVDYDDDPGKWWRMSIAMEFGLCSAWRNSKHESIPLVFEGWWWWRDIQKRSKCIMWWVGNSRDCSNPNVPETCIIIIILDHGVTTPLTSLFPSSSSSSNQTFWWGVLWDPQSENTSLLLDIVESHRDGLTTGGMNVYFPSSFCQFQQNLYGNQIDWELCTCQTTKTLT